MTYPFPPDLRELIGARLATGSYQSEDDLLRDALRALAAEEDDVDAVNEALAQWRVGDCGVPVDEAFDVVRSAHLPSTERDRIDG